MRSATAHHDNRSAHRGRDRRLEEVVAVVLSFDPFREMDRLASQLVTGTGQSSQRGPRWMPMDLYRSGDHYVVTVDLPGVDPGSIDLHVDGNTLSIRADRTLRPDDAAQWLAQERPAGSFLRQLNLGDGLDVAGIHASYDAGVLTVTIPVAEQAKPRRIAVDVGRQQRQEVTAVQGETT